MAFIGLRRGDITIHGINEDQFGLRWHRLLFPLHDMPAVHIGPLTTNVGTPAADGHVEQTLPAPIDETSSAMADSAGPGLAQGSTDDTTVPAPEADAEGTGGLLLVHDNVWHPPYLAPEPLVDGTGNPSIPSDSAPPGGFIPKSEALVWSGPALVPVSDLAHETGGGDGAPQSTADSGGASDTAGTPDTGAAPDTVGTPDTAGAPDTADAPDAVTRGDLDPILESMDGGHAILFDTGGGDLGAAFLPPDSDDPGDLGHGLDLGFSFTPPPLPPPPDVI